MTITSSSIWAVLSFGVVFAAAFGAVTLWRRRIPGLAPRRSFHVALYLSRYAAALEYYGLRRSEITSHVEALRGDLAAVAPNDVDATLRRLGPPRTLAAEVSDGTLRPSFLRGVIWWGITVLCTLALSILVTKAFLGGFEAVAEQGDKASWSGLGWDVEATMGEGGRAANLGFGGSGVIVLPLVAFVLGARLWRLRTTAKARSDTSPA